MTDKLLEALAQRVQETYNAECGELGSRLDLADALVIARAVLSEIDRQGYAVVPVKPTPEMWAAGAALADRTNDTWTAMLNARPKATE